MKIISEYLDKIFANRSKTYSYSQYGEDCIILTMLDLYKIQQPNYMDIGAFHPFKFSNTALLYKNRIRGVNIEPNPLQFRQFLRYRKHDINLNLGIYTEKGKIKYYQFQRSEYNTFSEETYSNTVKQGIKKINEILIDVDTYNNIVTEKLKGIPPVILFLDAEGLDFSILQSIDYIHFAPKIICVETYAYGAGKKDVNLINFLLAKGYIIHADTFVNTIFIHNRILNDALS